MYIYIYVSLEGAILLNSVLGCTEGFFFLISQIILNYNRVNIYIIYKLSEWIYSLLNAPVPAPELQHHMYRPPRRDPVLLDRLVVLQLLPGVYQANLRDFDSLFFLERRFY